MRYINSCILVCGFVQIYKWDVENHIYEYVDLHRYVSWVHKTMHMSIRISKD